MDFECSVWVVFCTQMNLNWLYIFVRSPKETNFKYSLYFMSSMYSGIRACIEAGEIADEEQFEISVDIHGIGNGPKLGRLRLLNKVDLLLLMNLPSSLCLLSKLFTWLMIPTFHDFAATKTVWWLHILSHGRFHTFIQRISPWSCDCCWRKSSEQEARCWKLWDNLHHLQRWASRTVQAIQRKLSRWPETWGCRSFSLLCWSPGSEQFLDYEFYCRLQTANS